MTRSSPADLRLLRAAASTASASMRAGARRAVCAYSDTLVGGRTTLAAGAAHSLLFRGLGQYLAVKLNRKPPLEWLSTCGISSSREPRELPRTLATMFLVVCS